jgi:predicted enzyme related to lactoylglutathione lyase
MLSVAMVTIDCVAPERLAQFWSAALELAIESDFGDFVMLGAPADGGTRIGLQRVAEPRTDKNRIHVDLRGEARATAVPRLQELGASIVAEHEAPGLAWTVLADPEGNQFCVGESAEG